MESQLVNLIASTTQSARRLLEREFALVLLDVRMPDMDGYEVARILKQDREIGKVPIVFVTAEANMDASVMKGYEAGGFDYLVKPVDPRILLGKARNLASEKDQDAAAAKATGMAM